MFKKLLLKLLFNTVTSRRNTNIILADLKRVRDELAENILSCAEQRKEQEEKIDEIDRKVAVKTEQAKQKGQIKIDKAAKIAEAKIKKVEEAQKRVISAAVGKVGVVADKAKAKTIKANAIINNLDKDAEEAKIWLEMFPNREI